MRKLIQKVSSYFKRKAYQESKEGDNNFAEAARAANLLFAKYKDFNTFKFTADNKKELFDLCEKMIGSQLCNYDQKT